MLLKRKAFFWNVVDWRLSKFGIKLWLTHWITSQYVATKYKFASQTGILWLTHCLIWEGVFPNQQIPTSKCEQKDYVTIFWPNDRQPAAYCVVMNLVASWSWHNVFSQMTSIFKHFYCCCCCFLSYLRRLATVSSTFVTAILWRMNTATV